MVTFLTGVCEELGLLAFAVSVAGRLMEGFDELVVNFSRFRARTVEPVADPKKAFRRVVVLDLVIPNLGFVCSVSRTPVPVARR